MNATQDRKFEYITIHRMEDYTTMKIPVFFVWSRRNDSLLGEVRWYDIRQRFCFFSNGAIVYDADCLRDIATFIEELNKR
jgi:hypothetical protein